jgi:iron complex outermembrane receptor protein
MPIALLNPLDILGFIPMKTLLFLVLTLSAACLVQAQEKDLFSLPFNELKSVEVTSVSKRQERASNAAAAVFVITQDDIRRSGATRIPQLLRMVPGVQVAEYDANTWAVSARGFNALFANKLLVLIDGMSVYSPLHSGVYWDQVDVPLLDIERIEVIRGPGASVWGANAVNGVINIITKESKDTVGTRARAGGGNEEQAFAELRHGVDLEDAGAVRVYAKGFTKDSSRQVGGGASFDDWQSAQTGFRYDYAPSTSDTIAVHGDLQYGTIEELQNFAVYSPPYTSERRRYSEYNGQNILAHWERKLGADSAFMLQAYYSRLDRSLVLSDERSEISDIDLQYQFGIGESHALNVGLGFRYLQDAVDSGPLIDKPIFNPRAKSQDLTSGFIQDEITLYPDLLKLTLGTKLEHNAYTGLEIQPSARVAYTPGPQQTIWAAYSRAVRTPARVDTSVVFDTAVIPQENGGLTSLTVLGDPSIDSEVLHAYELGYRSTPLNYLSFDFATFFNSYSGLRDTLPSPQDASFETSPAPHLQIPLVLTNARWGDVFGGEALITLQATDWWRLQLGYSYLHMDVLDSIGTRGIEHQLTVRSPLTLWQGVELDPMLRYVDPNPTLGISAYTELDVRLGYRLSPQLSLSIVGQNLLHSQHEEFFTPEISGIQAQIERSLYAMIDWNF